MKKNNRRNKKRKILGFRKTSKCKKIEDAILEIMENPNETRSGIQPYNTYFSKEKGTVINEGITTEEITKKLFENYENFSYAEKFLERHRIRCLIVYMREECQFPLYHIRGIDGFIFVLCKEHMELVKNNHAYIHEKNIERDEGRTQKYEVAYQNLESYEEVKETPIEKKLEKIKKILL